MADTEMKVYDWDDEITNDGEGSFDETAVLPAGNYDFEVIKTEKSFYQPGPKSSLPPCNMVKVYLRILGGEYGTGLVVENLYLCEKMEWKAAAFFRAIGMKKHDEPIKWRMIDHCDGERGRCRIMVDTFTGRDGTEKQNNKLERFYDPAEDKPAAAAGKKWSKGAF